jgi:inosine/guanosine/xanthosine phosphorylase family protein
MEKGISTLVGKAKLAVILGSGLSPFEDGISVRELFLYSDTDVLPVPTVTGHQGRILLFQTAAGNNVYLFAGRSHLYEGVSMKQAGAGVYLAERLGCERVLLVNAAGSLSSNIPVGSWFAPSDMVVSPFRQERHKGVSRYPVSFKCVSLISSSFRRRVLTVAREVSIPVYEGTLMWNVGPCYETQADAHAALEFGADAVTMSIIPELAASLDVGIEAAVLSWITNYTPNVRGIPVSHEEVIRKGKKARRMLFRVLDRL